jgi:hypothetical protein
MPRLYMNIGNGNYTWSSTHDKTGKYIKIAPPSYQICVGTDTKEGLSSPYGKVYQQKGWYQGCWFIRNPIENMPRQDFIVLMTSINETIKKKYETDCNHRPLFIGSSFIEIYPSLVNCMEEIINILKRETGNDNWTYGGGYGFKDYRLFQNLKENDEYARICM